MTSIDVNPLLPAGVVLATALVLIVAVALNARRRPTGTSRARWSLIVMLQSLNAFALICLLMNPVVRHATPALPGRPSVTLLIDSSESMATPDADGTRYASAVRDAAAIANRLHARFDVEIQRFDSTTRSSDLTQLAAVAPTGETSDIAGALRSLSKEGSGNPMSLVLLSDGIPNTHDPAAADHALDAADLAREMDRPIFTRTYGSAANATNLSLSLQSTQDLALLNQAVSILATVRYHGPSRANTVAHFRRDDGVEMGRTPVTLNAGDDEANVSFAVTADRVGLHRYDIVLDPIAGDATPDDDRSPYVLRVVDEPIRALVLEGKPYWDGTFLLRTLAADPAIAVDACVRVRTDRVIRRTISRSSGERSIPSTEPAERTESAAVIADPASVLTGVDALRPYQVVVIGRDAESFLTPAAVTALRDWIATAGGSLVCYRGNPTSTSIDGLASILPVRWSPDDDEVRGRIAFTDEGRAMHWTLDREANDDAVITQRMPTIPQDDRATAAGRPLAIVLAISTDATGRSQPAVTFQPFGAGRVVVVEGAGLWRWSFLPPAYRDREAVYTGLWQSMLRWLASGVGTLPGQRVSLRADKVVFDADDTVTATLFRSTSTTTGPDVERINVHRTDEPATAPITIETAGDAGSGMTRVTFGRLAPGRYSATVDGQPATNTGATIAFDVRRFGREMRDLSPRPDLLRRISERSGGRALISDSIADELEHALDDHRARATMSTTIEATAWDRPAVLVSLIVLWSTTWMLRRRSGLI